MRAIPGNISLRLWQYKASKVCTKMMEGQYSLVWHKHFRLVSTLLYDTPLYMAYDHFCGNGHREVTMTAELQPSRHLSTQHIQTIVWSEHAIKMQGKE